MSVKLPIVTELVDGFSRRIRYLRVSLTDRCNYRCSYCMPEEGMVFRRRAELLSFEEIERLLRIFTGLGVERVRLTGGEPTVRSSVVELVERLARVPGPAGAPLRLAMTTNGHRLPELAAPLAAAGLGEVNISVDTLDPERFREITRRGDLERVIAGIEAAAAAGMAVKLNAVALRGLNDGEIVEICHFAWDRGVIPRFIEHMPMSDGQIFDARRQISAAEIREVVQRDLGCVIEPVAADRAAGPARYWQATDGSRRTLGIISAMSEHFCDSCNRVRLSATGDLHACLGYDDATSLRDVIRAGGTDADVRAAIAACVSGKRLGHEFTKTGAGGPRKHMIAIGG